MLLRLTVLDLPARQAPRAPRIGVLVQQQDTVIFDDHASHAHMHRGSLPRATELTASLAATVTGVSAGSSSTRLIVLRGNSGSGKSSVAAEIRARYGRGIALVGQDNLRRVVLHERDVPGGANIGLIDTVTRYALCEFHVVVEGILRAAHYGPMLEALHRDHQSVARFYYLDVPLEETLRRHANRPQATEFGEADMRAWYRERDLLPGGIEQIIPAASSLEDTVRLVMLEAGLVGNSLQPATQP